MPQDCNSSVKLKACRAGRILGLREGLNFYNGDGDGESQRQGRIGYAVKNGNKSFGGNKYC